MRGRAPLVVTLLALSACAHAREELPPPPPEMPVILAPPEAPPTPEPPPAARPRLSHTITLGHNDDPYLQAPEAAAAAAPAPEIVNNNIVVQPQPVYVYGAPFGGYGYGYGAGYGARGGRSADARPVARPSSGSPPSASGPTGWEGARGTAAPGHTPGIGGNWSSPPSYGPTQMK